MDGQRFDAFARAFAARPSRRQLLRGLAGSAVAGVLALLDAKRLRAHEDGANRVRVCFEGRTVEVPLPVDGRLFPGLSIGPCPSDGGCTADADCADGDADPCTGGRCEDGACVYFIVTCAAGFVCCGNGECCPAPSPNPCAAILCPECRVCDPTSGACVAANQGGACGQGGTCCAGTCCATACGTGGACPPDGGCTADADCGGLDPDSCIGNACVDGECVPFSVDCIVGAVCCGNGECCEACGPTVCAPGDVCCNPSCGICTPPDGVCIQVACE